MVNVELLDLIHLTQAFQNASYVVTLFFKYALPGILLVACHVIVCVVACNNHQWVENNLLVILFLYSFYNVIQRRSGLNSTDVVVVCALCGQSFLQLCISSVCLVLCAMTHEYNCGVLVVVLLSGIYQCLCNILVVLVRSQQRSTHGNSLELILVLVYSFYQIVILVAAHNVSWLDNQFLYTIVNQSLQSFLYVVDFDVVTLFQNVDNSLAGECSANLAVWVCLLNCLFDCADGLFSAVVVAGTKANCQDNRLLFGNRGGLCNGCVGCYSSGFRGGASSQSEYTRCQNCCHNQNTSFFHCCSLPF